MYTSPSIGVDAWVRIEGHCPITYEPMGEQMQFRLGSARGCGLTVVLTEQALENLIVAFGEGLRALRADPVPTEPHPR